MNGMEKPGPDREALRHLADTGEAPKKAFEVLAKRQRKRRELSLEVLMQELRADGVEITRAQAYSFFKELERCGCGRIKLGRGSRPTRFRWRYTMRSIAQLALGQTDTVQIMPELDAEEIDNGEGTAPAPPDNTAHQDGPALCEKYEKAMGRSDPQAPVPSPREGGMGDTATPSDRGIRIVNYPYPLRPGLLVSVSLPVDMTTQEAERMAAYIKTLAAATPQKAACSP